ncbi:hypothetical protein L4D00_21220 [Photobacterium swingsii]|uniref:hypothetical protein n=1 Tax=Photobacterium swingsii TaxID=680026 RepID=UPI000A5A96B2|nr:hypothetical protein [Photobacterium swingsii]
MENIYTCIRCHQSDEFLISEAGTYTCICGYQFVIEHQEQTQQDTEATTQQRHAVH